MRFQFVPKSVTLNDLECRLGFSIEQSAAGICAWGLFCNNHFQVAALHPFGLLWGYYTF